MTKFNVGEPVTSVVVDEYLLIIALLSGGIKIVDLSVSYGCICSKIFARKNGHIPSKSSFVRTNLL